jgi:hypothetical protein
MPSHILLGHPWLLRHPVAAATVVFIDNLSRLLARIDNVNVGLLPGSDVQPLSPGIFDLGVFDSMLDLTTSPPTHSSSAIWRQVPASISFDVNNHICGFFVPPWVMLHFNIETSVPWALLLAARGYACVGSSMGDVLYFFYGYIGNLQYCFELAPVRTRKNIILADPLDGRMTCYLEAILPEGALPPDGVNRWVTLQHEDPPSGEEGSSVTRSTQVVTVSDENGPARAHGGALAPLLSLLVGPMACPRGGERS